MNIPNSSRTPILSFLPAAPPSRQRGRHPSGLEPASELRGVREAVA